MSTAVQPWKDAPPAVVSRGIDEATWNALKSTVYPGAKDESILLAVDYCRARKLDPMLKPVHLVPMQVKVVAQGKRPVYEWRDVPMPGIGLYRIQAARSGDFGGMDEAEFGQEVTREFESSHEDERGKVTKKTFPVAYPLWCKVTVYKIVQGVRCAFTAKEFWTENYATTGKGSEAPNAMWKRRPYAQLAKCAEAQALRKAWPEVCDGHTAEEMAGKTLDLDDLRDITPPAKPAPAAREPVNQAEEPIEGEIVEPQGEAQAREPEAAGPLIKPNHVKMITSKLARFSNDGSDLLHMLQADSIESIPLAKLNDAMDYVNKLGKGE